MKKKLLFVVSMLAVASLSVGTTLAYLQAETEETVNTMTVGNVDVEQFEMQRAEGVAHIGTAKEGDLIPFVENQFLLPAVPTGELPYTAEPTELFYYGSYVTDEGAGNGLWDNSKLANAMDKFVFVKNTGNTPCYFRTVYAFEVPEELTFGDAAYDHIGANVNSGYTWSDIGYTTIDGVRYYIMVATYGNWNDGVLSANEIARPSLLQVALNHNVTNEQVALFGETYDVKVLTQAVQVEGFADAETALDAAFDEISIENHPFK